MLHAIEKGKTKYFRRYLGHRDGEERNVHEEDEITSTVLGPLDFLAPSDIHDFWRRVLETAGYSEFLPQEHPVSARIELWPRRYFDNNNSFIEPDTIVRFRWSDGKSRLLLVEMKWRAKLSGEDQLHQQWLHFLSEEERSQALHLFIAPELSAGAKAPNNEDAGGDVWSKMAGISRLVLVPWLHIRSVFSALGQESSPLGRWAQVADKFLEKVQIKKFKGFHNLTSNISLPPSQPKTVFWKPPLYWSSLGNAPALPKEIPDFIFFPSA